LKTQLNEELFDNPDIFNILDKDFLLDSIDYYISETQPARGVAEDYRRTIIELFKAICSEYNIKNTFLESTSEQRDFYNITKEQFEYLRQSESRGCMTFEKFELLDEAIRNFFSADNIEEKIKASITNKNASPNYYRRLVSAIVLKLIQKYGLANATIPKLKFSDLDLGNRILKVKDFNLYLTDELIFDFELYLKFRDLILQNEQIETDILFITREGNLYLNKNGYSENEKLFSLMQDTLGNREVTELRYRAIIELVSKGANINLLHQLTDVKKETIVELCIEDKSHLENIFKGISPTHTLEHKKIRKGQLRCPYCGNYKDASSKNWILIQVPGDDKKYLACRECRGLDGKYRY